jgi:hypothetical protein
MKARFYIKSTFKNVCVKELDIPEATAIYNLPSDHTEMEAYTHGDGYGENRSSDDLISFKRVGYDYVGGAALYTHFE